MKKSFVIAATALAGALGFSSIASAQWGYTYRNPQPYTGNLPAQVQPNGYYPDEQFGTHGGHAPYVVQQKRAIADWRVHGLYAPPVGYQWYDYGNNNYALVQLANGVIAQMLRR